jgi:hypothetical protein
MDGRRNGRGPCTFTDWLDLRLTILCATAAAFLTALGCVVWPREPARRRSRAERFTSAAVLLVCGGMWYAAGRLLLFLAVTIWTDYFHRLDVYLGEHASAPGLAFGLAVLLRDHPYAHAGGWFLVTGGLAFLLAWIRSPWGRLVGWLAGAVFLFGYATFICWMIGSVAPLFTPDLRF